MNKCRRNAARKRRRTIVLDKEFDVRWKASGMVNVIMSVDHFNLISTRPNEQ